MSPARGLGMALARANTYTHNKTHKTGGYDDQTMRSRNHVISSRSNSVITTKIMTAFDDAQKAFYVATWTAVDYEDTT